MTSAENYSFNAEAAFRHVTQRVQELADALHEEQRKHQRVEQEVAQLRGYICSNMPKGTVPGDMEVGTFPMAMSALEKPEESQPFVGDWTNALKSEILDAVRREQEAFKDRYLLDTRTAENVKNLELTIGHVSQELHELLQKVGGSEASPKVRDSILCSAKTTLEGAFLEVRDDQLPVAASRGIHRDASESRLSSVTLDGGGAESTATSPPNEEPKAGLAVPPSQPGGFCTPQPPPQQCIYHFKDPFRKDTPQRYVTMQWSANSQTPTHSWPQRRSLPVQNPVQRMPGGNTSVPVPMVMRRDAPQENRVIMVPPRKTVQVTRPGTMAGNDERRTERSPHRATMPVPFAPQWKGQAMPKLVPNTLRMKAPR